MSAPVPPILLDSKEQFLEHVAKNLSLWFEYCQSAYHWISSTSTAASATSTDLQNELEAIRLSFAEADNKNSELQEKILY